MNQKLLLITPPFTQLNTPYPATAYLKGFLNTKKVSSFQVDLGIEVILKLFSSNYLKSLFDEIEIQNPELSANSQRIFSLKEDYINTIDEVIAFLQNKKNTLSHLICEGEYLPEASRFEQLDDLDWAFGSMGLKDKARHLATLYLEDISDFIKEVIDPHFGFSRYAERLGMSASTFDELDFELNQSNTFVDDILVELLEEKIINYEPTLVCLSVPFPGNLYSALKCGQHIKNKFPAIKISMGGGYPNTELRSLTDPRVFNYLDFITLDDGEAPLINLIEFLEGKRQSENLKRIFISENNKVVYINGSNQKDYAQKDVGTPDYSDLFLDQYLSVIEIVNPMHRLWSDGRWNKLTLAHGCYWGKCTFCDISLDYIKNYEPNTAKMLCDRIEEIIEQTGENGFHFVDEAAPPALMRELALEILRRKLTVVWWGNIRFEKNFTADLCRLLKASGCIAVSGGLEVASDRLLELIKKGVTVAQVAKVAENFTSSGILVHAYLMYGFPTQSAQETVDSLEIVRQLFMNGVLHSGFWHRFAMTAHSPVGLEPEEFKVKNLNTTLGTFANNDLVHEDPDGCDHQAFSEGLRKSLFNYMHGVCLDFELQEWFDFRVPQTTIPNNFIERALIENHSNKIKPNSKIVWLGNKPSINYYSKKKKGKNISLAELIFHNKKEDLLINVKSNLGMWLNEILPLLSVASEKVFTYKMLEESFIENRLGDFHIFWNSHSLKNLREGGLLVL